MMLLYDVLTAPNILPTLLTSAHSIDFELMQGEPCAALAG